MRESLCALIDRQPDMQVVAEAENGHALLRGLKGVDAVRHMINDSPGIKLLALSMHANRRFADEMIKAGACGYLLKDHAFEELVRAIQAVAENRIYLCPGLEDSAEPDSG
jgi:DNA-binding NarL/FixJ family response regulator